MLLVDLQALHAFGQCIAHSGLKVMCIPPCLMLDVFSILIHISYWFIEIVWLIVIEKAVYAGGKAVLAHVI